MENHITLTELTQAIAAIVGAITIAGIILKLLFRFIDMKWTIERTGYVRETHLQDELKEYAKTADIINELRNMLDTYCRNAQSRCPRAADITKMSDAASTLAGSVTFLLGEQKKLREETLPERYVTRSTFKDTADRIERSVDKAVEKFDEVAENIYNRINKVNENWEVKFIELMKDKG